MDKEEYIRIVEKYYEDVKRVAFAGCRDMYDAEDIAQTVFMKLLSTSEIFEDDENLKMWLIRVAVNEYKSLWRSPWKSKVDFYIPEEKPGKKDRNEEKYLVLEAVLKLKQKYREVIHLFYYEDYSAKEIGELLGISESTVFKRLQRGRDRLREQILRSDKTGGIQNDRWKRFTTGLQRCD